RQRGEPPEGSPQEALRAAAELRIPGPDAGQALTTLSPFSAGNCRDTAISLGLVCWRTVRESSPSTVGGEHRPLSLRSARSNNDTGVSPVGGRNQLMVRRVLLWAVFATAGFALLANAEPTNPAKKDAKPKTEEKLDVKSSVDDLAAKQIRMQALFS